MISPIFPFRYRILLREFFLFFQDAKFLLKENFPFEMFILKSILTFLSQKNKLDVLNFL